jgi:hypothetical protein
MGILDGIRQLGVIAGEYVLVFRIMILVLLITDAKGLNRHFLHPLVLSDLALEVEMFHLHVVDDGVSEDVTILHFREVEIDEDGALLLRRCDYGALTDFFDDDLFLLLELH